MDIRHKRVCDLTKVERRACYLANYGFEGYMREVLAECTENNNGRVVLLWDGPDDTVRSLIGWALLSPVANKYSIVAASDYARKNCVYTAQFWVKRQYRRKGYGKILVAEAKKYDPRPYVLPHDIPSAELFSSFNVRTSSYDRKWLRRKPKLA